MQAMEEALAASCDSAISDEDFCAADVQFHRAIVDATANGPLRFVMYAVVEALLPITNLITFRVRDRKAIIAFHERMLLGIRDHKSKQAIAALRELIDYLQKQYSRSAAAREARSTARLR
jgi:DNA-binding FadR family transcriptional regulator